ncbi:hypothetical protein N7G274_009032 [Stereocaulon virgatum]|uniref:Major facilitator superfamily (MFS) profile domain-containing protein n=1 Tax=Stereocaulon virgatum TaxID=373712 RepID=A0ABR3ZZ50_9LECA
MHSEESSQPYLLEIRSSKFFVYTVINLAVFTDAYLYGLIIPILPFALVERVHLHEEEVQQWIGLLLAAYGAGLIIGAPIAGWFADRTSSRRVPYLVGLVALAFATLAFSLGHSTVVLFVGRLIQGASSAAVHTVGMAILADTVGQDGIGPAMGFVGMSIALGVVLGPILGGILYHHCGYLAVFTSAYALVGLDFLFRVFMMTEKDSRPRQPIVQINHQDYGTISDDAILPGNPASQDDVVSTSHPESSCLLWTPSTPRLTESNTSASSQQPPAYTILNRKPSNPQRYPIIVLLTSSRMLAALLGEFMQSLILTGLESILPLRIKTIFGYNSMQVALVFLSLSFSTFVGPVVGHLSDRMGAKIMVCLGFVYAAPLIILLRLVDHDGESELILLCCLLFLLGIALNMVLTPVWSEVSYLIDDRVTEEPGIFGSKGAYAQAFSLMNVAYASGSLIGPLTGSFLVEILGWNDVTLATGILCALCVLPCLFATGGKRAQKSSVRMEGEVNDGFS